jgi:hypothetical protein
MTLELILLVTQCSLYLAPPELISFHLSVLTLVIILSNKLSWLFSQQTSPKIWMT